MQSAISIAMPIHFLHLPRLPGLPHHDLRDFRVPDPSACRCGGDLRPDVAHGSSVEASSLPRFDRAETLTVAFAR